MFSKLYSKSLIMILTFLFLGSFFSCAKKEPADLVLMNGKIVTIDDKKPEVQALAVRGDVIVALGSDKRIKSYISQATQVIDLEGNLAIPGFIDAHGHFTGLGSSKMRLDFMHIKDWDEVVSMVKKAARRRLVQEFYPISPGASLCPISILLAELSGLLSSPWKQLRPSP